MNRIKREHLRLLLTPSMLSSVLIICTSLFLIIGSVLISLGKSGHLKNYLFAVNYASQGFHDRYTSIANSLDSNHIVSQLPLLIFWGVVGLITYMFAVNLFKALVEINSVEKSLHYVHAKPDEIVKEKMQHLGLRASSLIAIWVIVTLFFKNLLPFCLSVVRDVSLRFTTSGTLKLLGLILLLLIVGHMLTIAIRLALLRPRAFNY